MKQEIKESIRNEYVHGYLNEAGQRIMPTIDDLIKQYNVPASSTYRASSKEGWKQQKKEFLSKLRQGLDETKNLELQDQLYKCEKFISEITYGLFSKTLEILNSNDTLSPSGLASLSNATLTAQRIFVTNKPTVTNTEDNEAFESIMGILDEIEAFKRSSG